MKKEYKLWPEKGNREIAEVVVPLTDVARRKALEGMRQRDS